MERSGSGKFLNKERMHLSAHNFLYFEGELREDLSPVVVSTSKLEGVIDDSEFLLPVEVYKFLPHLLRIQ